MLKWRLPRTSFFYRMFSWFLLIVLLLLVFNIVSFTLFLSTIRDETIQNSRLNLKMTVNHYENLLNRIRSIGLSLLIDEKMNTLIRAADGQINYEAVADIRRDKLLATMQDSLLYMDNLFFYLPEHGLMIERAGTRTAQEMFERYYYSESYNLDFWQKELSRPVNFRVYPAAQFHEKFNYSERALPRQIPVLVQSVYYRQLAIIFMLNSEKMYNGFYPAAAGDRFRIVSGEGQVLYGAGDDGQLSDVDYEALTGEAGHTTAGSNYLFYQRGKETGFLYVSIIPTQQVSSHIIRLTMLMSTVLVLVLLVSVAASYYFTRRLSNPLRKIVEAINNMRFSAVPQTDIKEFAFISDQFNHLYETNRNIHLDLNRKNSLLQQYALTTKMKQIYTDWQDIRLPLAAGKPYILVGFQLIFRSAMEPEIGMEPERAAYFFREYIQTYLCEAFGEALTFQVERDVILTLLFPEHDSDQCKLPAELLRLKEVLDLDRRYCLFTIAYSDAWTEYSDFGRAYPVVAEMLNSRKLGEDTQIITQMSDAAARMPEDEGREFYTHLTAGNAAGLIETIQRKLRQMKKRGGELRRFSEFSRSVVHKVLQALPKEQSEKLYPANPLEEVEKCFTLEHYEQFFHLFLTSAAAVVQEKKTTRDPTIQFVTDYVEKHYGDDLSLDLIADKLGLHRSYLSTYFKERHGENFSDYVNEVRMSRAKELLITTDYKIQEIAALVGYLSVNAFIRNFKKYTGLPPGEFRKNMKREG
ncbi:helix-turn-helix domain-containing protein [Paenibacillus sp. GCM10027626]|uniref:helix-turn-helix domain-containing protein n=1 Tax=Paenibacillus sp. GCM10027626 TaxID=3273411 RepID=UPI003630A8D5